MPIEQLKDPIQPLEGGFIPVAPAIETEGRNPVIALEETPKPSPDKNVLTKTTETPSSEGQEITENQQGTALKPTFDSKAPLNGNSMSNLVTDKNLGFPVPD